MKLPDHPNIEHLRAQAKDRLVQLRTTNPLTQLAAAQRLIAREYGFASWPKLVGHVKQIQIALADFQKVIEIVEAGVWGDRFATDARRAFNLHPTIHRASSACLLSSLRPHDLKVALTQIDLSKPIGIANALPVCYVAFSPLAGEKPKEYVECLRLMINAGADPNSTYIHRDYPDSPLSILFAAAGSVRSPEATKLLLEAGANPTDGESVYHASESRDHTCLKLLFQYGAKAVGNDLARMLDFEDLDGLNIFIHNGADLNHPNALIHAIRRGRSAEIIRRLVEAGADPTLPDADGLTAQQIIFEHGLDLPDLLIGFEPDNASQLLKACWIGNILEAQGLKNAYSNLTAKQRKAFTDACWAGSADSVDAFIAGGFGWEDRDDSRGTPLHCAAFAGQTETVRALLRHGPPLDDQADMYQAIPIQWAAYASAWPVHEGKDFVGVVNLLVEAGTPPPTRIFGSPEVREILRTRWPKLEEEPE